MNYIRNVLKGILNEESVRDDVMNAIRNKQQVVIRYNSKKHKEGNRGLSDRLIEPCVYGKSPSGDLVIRAFQPNGDTESRVPSWKEFCLSRITSWQTNGKTFSKPPGLNKMCAKFNENGDKSMSEIFMIAKFSNDANAVSQNSNSINTNSSSVNSMKSSNNFGNNNYKETNGPVYKNKNNTLNASNNSEEVDYSEVEKNGPVFKGNNNSKNNEDNIDDRETIHGNNQQSSEIDNRQ